MTGQVRERTYEESCAVLDEIVGRCVRDLDFGCRVLEDPATALEPFHLHQHELDDFLTLRRDHRDRAAAGWESIRTAMEALGRRGLGPSRP